MAKKTEKNWEKARWFILGVALTILLFQGIFLFSIKKDSVENHWGEHSRCYYFNEQTECGKTRYCATHVSEEKCLELGGEWLLETQENEMLERYYYLTLKGGGGNSSQP